MFWTRDRLAAMLPIMTAFAQGKTVEYGREGEAWTACESLGFSSDPSHYRIRPDDTIVAGEDLRGPWAEIRNGVAISHGFADEVWETSWLYVPEPISKGDRVQVIKSNNRDFRDKLVRVPDPVATRSEPHLDGELSWAVMREKGQEFADDESLIPMVRDLGYWLVLAINQLETYQDAEDEPEEPVCDANWKTDSVATEFIGRGAKAFRLGSGNWLRSVGPECQSETIQYYDCISDIAVNQAAEVNETTKQIRAAESAVCDANQGEFDEVNRPKHYTTDASGYECVQLAELLYDSLLFNAFKYLFRDGKKESSPRDLEKSLWYMRRFVAPGDEIDPDDVNIYKVIHGRPWPIGEAIRLIWSTTGGESTETDKQSVAEAARIIQSEIDRRKEVAK